MDRAHLHLEVLKHTREHRCPIHGAHDAMLTAVTSDPRSCPCFQIATNSLEWDRGPAYCVSTEPKALAEAAPALFLMNLDVSMVASMHLMQCFAPRLQQI